MTRRDAVANVKCSSATKNPCQRQGVRADVTGRFAVVYLHYSV